MNKTICLLCTIISFSSFAKSFEIRSNYEEETQFIKVVDNDQQISFEFCDRVSKDCEILGQKKFYSKISLFEKKHNEYAKSVVSLIGDLALGGGIAYGSAYFFGAVVAMNFEITAMGLATAGGGVAGFTVSEVVLMSMEAMNPMNHYESGKLLSMAISDEAQVQDIILFKRDLEMILSEIDTVIYPSRLYKKSNDRKKGL